MPVKAEVKLKVKVKVKVRVKLKVKVKVKVFVRPCWKTINMVRIPFLDILPTDIRNFSNTDGLIIDNSQIFLEELYRQPVRTGDILIKAKGKGKVVPVL